MASTTQVLEVPLARIELLPSQPRQAFSQAFSDAQIAALAATIERQGLLQPLLVRAHPARVGCYQLVAGERRLRALRYLGRTRVLVVLRQIADEDLLETALLENLQREALTPLEEAHAYRKLCDVQGYSQQQLASRLGKDRSTITNTLRLLGLPSQAQAALQAGQLSAGHARTLLACPPEFQELLQERIVRKKLSVRASEELVKRWQRQRQTRSKPSLPSPSDLLPPLAAKHVWFEQARVEMERALSTQVTLHYQANHGKVVIHFHSVADFNRLYQLIKQD